MLAPQQVTAEALDELAHFAHTWYAADPTEREATTGILLYAHIGLIGREYVRDGHAVALVLAAGQ